VSSITDRLCGLAAQERLPYHWGMRERSERIGWLGTFEPHAGPQRGGNPA